ncbi:MAG TPA: hypothetical protein VG754_05140 [Verrucomicrobiae bacterium]|nr:hypothetical protein [Verrucomicrobiae bacterium]
MKWLRWLACLFLFCVVGTSRAHIGSPDVFYEGAIGPYPAHVTIRMPVVVPGRAQILVRTDTNSPVEVSFRPLFVGSAVTNAPPADIGHLVPGETNLYTGDLWLMTFGGYSIEVKMRGAAGEGAVEIPVNSVALKQMPMPRAMGIILSALGVLLVLGGAAIVKGAASDSTIAPGVAAGKRERRKGWIAGSVTLFIVTGALVLGALWWKLDERQFREQLNSTNPPKLSAETRVEGSQRILRLTLGDAALDSDGLLRLLPDHDKLVHLFLIRQDARDAFAHLHPIRKGNAAFEVALPPLPAGRYDIFCDLTLENSGLSTTATNVVELPPPVAENVSFQRIKILDADPDDSWAASPNATLPPMGTATNAVFQFADGGRVVWKAHGPLRARQDAGLQFEVTDAAGNPARLEPYMGMISHAAVLRADNGVFAHLHPAGNFSMAAQRFYESKLAVENAACAPPGTSLPANAEHSIAGHGNHISSGENSTISLPYEFPTAGNYRVWVQIKTGGRVLTAVFDAMVSG